MTNTKLVLINLKTREPLKIGDTVMTFRGEQAILVGMQEPRHSGSTGRVTIREVGSKHDGDFYPSVIGAEWFPAGWEVA